LTAPFPGIITTSPTTTAGVQLLASDYFELINPDTLLFKAEVDEADIALIKLNQKATLNLDSHPDDSITSYVNYISYTSSQTSNGTVFLIELPLDSTRYGMDFFRLGMNGDVAIELESKANVITIPLVALKEREGLLSYGPSFPALLAFPGKEGQQQQKGNADDGSSQEERRFGCRWQESQYGVNPQEEEIRTRCCLNNRWIRLTARTEWAEYSGTICVC
jgi:hypothetical protein